MKNCLKYTLLLFYVVLAFAGHSAANCAGAPYTLALSAEEAHSQEELSVNKLHKFVGLQRAEEQVNVLSNLPAPPSKQDTSGFADNFYAFELRIQAIASQYIAHAEDIHQSLTNGDIIFPFHYFW